MFILLSLKDRGVEKVINNKIEGVFGLLHSLDLNDSTYEIIDDEFGKLRDEIVKIILENKLLAKQSEESQEILREYTEDIAHQIKTPLTGAILMLDLMEEDCENSREYMSYLKSNLNRLHGLADVLLKMASLDSGNISMKKESVDIKDLLVELISEIESYFPNQNNLILVFGEDFNLVCDQQWTYEAIFNIVKNGLEASSEKGIEICLKETKVYKSILIIDYSEGLSDDILKKSYKRFYKVNPDSKGFGIGLPMAKSIIERQNGELLYNRGKEFNYFELRFYK